MPERFIGENRELHLQRKEILEFFHDLTRQIEFQKNLDEENVKKRTHEIVKQVPHCISLTRRLMGNASFIEFMKARKGEKGVLDNKKLREMEEETLREFFELGMYKEALTKILATTDLKELATLATQTRVTNPERLSTFLEIVSHPMPHEDVSSAQAVAEDLRGEILHGLPNGLSDIEEIDRRLKSVRSFKGEQWNMISPMRYFSQDKKK